VIRYAVTRRDRVAYRLASLALRIATPAYRRFVTLAWHRGVTDLYANPPEPGEAFIEGWRKVQHNDGADHV
jgi:hypothetical protein